MKRVIVLLIFAALIYGYHLSQKAKEYTEFQKWKECIEQSDYSDTECEECDRRFNKDGKFELIQ